MKFNAIFALIGVAGVLAACNKQDLPYDLDGVEHGVIISISKLAGTSTTLSTDQNEGDYQVVLTIPSLQGDWSMLQEAQLTAVYTDGARNKKAVYAIEGIKEFPCTLKVDIKDVCTKLGISEIEVGDRVEFTPSYTLKSGTQVDGWTALTGFNNTAFAAWQNDDGTAIAYRVAYTAFAPFQKDKFQGDAVAWDSEGGDEGTAKVTQITDLPDAAWIPAGVGASDLVGLKVEGDIWFGGDTFLIWINTQDYTLIIPDQVIRPNFTYGSYGTYDGQAARCEGEVDTLNNTLSFYFYSIWGPYTFGDDTITLYFE